MRISLMLICEVLFLVACSSLSPDVLPSPSLTESITKTETPTFHIENLPNRVVTLSELGLEKTTRILVFDSKSEQVLSISDQSIDTFQKIQSGVNSLRDGIKISPNYHWFAYLEINDGFNIRIISMDGTQQFIGVENSVGSSFRWLSNDKIAVYNKLGFWIECPSELQIFDLFTKTVNNIPPVSSSGSPYCFPIPYFNSGFSQGLYLDSETGWQLYDYKTQTSYSVLPGLDTSPGGNKYFFQWTQDGLSFAIPTRDKIAFIQNLPQNEFIFTPPTKVIALPEGTLNENSGFDVWVPEQQLVGFDLAIENGLTSFNCINTQTFVMIDLMSQTLKNYCLDRSTFSTQIGSPWFSYISADYRFVGWTIRELPGNVEPLGAVILDTQTGKVSYLEGYELLGFGEITP